MKNKYESNSNGIEPSQIFSLNNINLNKQGALMQCMERIEVKTRYVISPITFL